MSVNKCIVLGRVGKDPEVKQFDGGSKASFSVATTERWYVSKTGETIPDRVTWHNIVCWKGLATIAERFVKKGDLIYIEGKITTRSWESDGKKHYMTEIVADNIELLGNKSEKVEKYPFDEPPMGEPVYRENKFDKGINADDSLPF